MQIFFPTRGSTYIAAIIRIANLFELLLPRRARRPSAGFMGFCSWETAFRPPPSSYKHTQFTNYFLKDIRIGKSLCNGKKELVSAFLTKPRLALVSIHTKASRIVPICFCLQALHTYQQLSDISITPGN